ncbi:hypothetical protein GHT06_017750 [Daphnia sinensis]|uniref:Uncharacterized protein n=1 Tax=Daphnia sinensis TaxID=1820382 RepID=A0AAD5L2X9_9CRUS|nr:hypothetical protein GHT06_017750 [Daphnia sinensis]
MNTVQGFCDFNIPSICSPTTTLRDVVIRAVKLGYGAIAINTTIEEDVLITTKKKTNKKGDAVEDKKEIPLPPKLNFTQEELDSFKVHGKNVKILHRLTVMLSDPTNTQKLVQSVNTKSYDLIAVCPTTPAAFMHAVANMDVDIITYHPMETKEIRFNRRQYHQATDRGIFFEIPYAFMLRDSTMRKKIIHMSHQYHSIGKSRNIIIGSGAITPLELRAPYDVANLGLLFGLTEGEARSALTLSGRSVALHAVTRKTGKCVSFISETDKLDPEERWKAQEIADAEERLLGKPESKKMKMDIDTVS